jgi:tRNA threonylcarbamoyladenosine biosynthesis protein TsaB
MRVLGIDGALGGFSVALLDGAAFIESVSGHPDALEAGLGRIDDVLSRGGVGLGDLDRLAVGIGPGSFTGVRIAISYAKALALARGLPLVGISSYDVLTPADAPAILLTVVPGRPGVVSARLREPGGERSASGPVAGVIDALLADWPGGELAACGNVEDVRSTIAERGIVLRAIPPGAESPARAVARLALTAEPAATPHAVAPDYGELPAATVRAQR